uniref:Uncharacterized protein n=1 Tax=Hippocampus comes TaxID=109280 RepID=A0A3Q2Y986_HIPCM
MASAAWWIPFLVPRSSFSSATVRSQRLSLPSSLMLCFKITFRIQQKNQIRSHIKTTKFEAELMRLDKDGVYFSYSLVQYFDLIPFHSESGYIFLHYGFNVSSGSNGTICYKILKSM